MTIVEATRELEPRDERPIGWGGKRLDEMLAESERLFAETGAYAGLAGDLELKDSEPIEYEKLFSRLRGGLVTARALSLSLGAPVAGVSTLAALAAGSSDAVPVIDGRRGEVFTLEEGVPVVHKPEDMVVERGRTYVGDGAVLYRAELEARGAEIPADSDQRHIPWARHTAALAKDFGPADGAEPIYLRVPDAEKALER